MTCVETKYHNSLFLFLQTINMLFQIPPCLVDLTLWLILKDDTVGIIEFEVVLLEQCLHVEAVLNRMVDVCKGLLDGFDT